MKRPVFSLSFPNGNQLSFEDYKSLKKELDSQLKSHPDLEFNIRKYYVTDFKGVYTVACSAGARQFEKYSDFVKCISDLMQECMPFAVSFDLQEVPSREEVLHG